MQEPTHAHPLSTLPQPDRSRRRRRTGRHRRVPAAAVRSTCCPTRRSAGTRLDTRRSGGSSWWIGLASGLSAKSGRPTTASWTGPWPVKIPRKGQLTAEEAESFPAGSSLRCPVAPRQHRGGARSRQGRRPAVHRQRLRSRPDTGRLADRQAARVHEAAELVPRWPMRSSMLTSMASSIGI